MVTSLLKYERIKTTDAKAKELRSWADRMITLAKRGDLHARRQALAVVREKSVVNKLFEEAGEKFGGLNSGFTRVIKIGRRRGDAAPMAVVELVRGSDVAPPSKKTKKPPAAAPAGPSAPPAPADEPSAAGPSEPTAAPDSETAHSGPSDATDAASRATASPAEEGSGDREAAPADADARRDPAGPEASPGSDAATEKEQ
jgi:large subunit ribosomal protein L17